MLAGSDGATIAQRKKSETPFVILCLLFQTQMKLVFMAQRK